MKTTISEVAISRLKNSLISDKHFKPEKLEKILKSEIFEVLKNYAEIKPSEINFCITVDEGGEYIINLNATTRRLKVLGVLPEENIY